MGNTLKDTIRDKIPEFFSVLVLSVVRDGNVLDVRSCPSVCHLSCSRLYNIRSIIYDTFSTFISSH